MNTRLMVLLLAVLGTGCASVQQGLQKAVVMEYDQRDNFSRYELDHPIAVGNGQTVQIVQAKGGFWASFVICTLRNEATQAQAFPYDANKFYVDIDGEKFRYRRLQSDQWNHSAGIITALVEERFEQETLIPQGGMETFPVGFDSALNFRLAVFIPATASAKADPRRLILRYEGYPNFLTSRNHAAEEHSDAIERSDLATLCRPQAR